MATIRGKNKKTTTRVDNNGNIYNNTQSGPVGRIHDGGMYDQSGKLTGRYQGGKIYDQDGPEGGKVIGQYEGGKIYDHMGYWGGNVIGYYSGDAFKEVSEYDRYRPPSDVSSSTTSNGDHHLASPPQQDRSPGTYAEKKVPRPPVRPQSGQGRGISFLMSKCRYCGSPAKVKYYKLLLVLTPFALLFYALIFYAIASVAFTNQNDTSILVNVFASIITASIFLTPGLVALFVLRSLKGVCDACRQMVK